MNKVAIIGPGLLGGSIAMALRKKSPVITVSIWARREEAVGNREEGGSRRTLSPRISPLVVADADLVVLCIPIGAMVGIASQLVGFIKAGAMVTDVGSVKGPVVEALASIFTQKGRFIGSHPMAGSERAGIEAAQATLLRTQCAS